MMITMRSIGSDLQKAYELAEMYLLPRKNEHKKRVRLHETIIQFPKISIKTLFWPTIRKVEGKIAQTGDPSSLLFASLLGLFIIFTMLMFDVSASMDMSDQLGWRWWY